MHQETTTSKICRQQSSDEPLPKKKKRHLLTTVKDSGESKQKLISEHKVEEEETDIAEEKDEPEETPIKRRKIKSQASISSSSSQTNLKSFNGHGNSSISSCASQGSTKNLSECACKDVDGVVCEGQFQGRNFSHLSYNFLKPGNIRDAQGRRPDDPEYDPRTLYLPESFKQNLSPTMCQWWDMKVRINKHC
jgi:DNA mismatch repair protein MSH6